MRPSSIYAVALSVVTALACQTTVNVGKVTDTSEPDTDTGTSADTNDATTNPGTTNPGTTEPGTTNPGTTDESTTNPGTTDPNTTDTTGDSTGTTGTTSDSTTGDSTGTTGSTSDGTSTTTGTTDGTSTTGGTSTSGGDADLAGWTKYREVLIDNGLAKELTDFQVAVKVTYDADMSPDYADLRFTDESGMQLLPYWIEWDLGPVEAYIWVRVPVIAADDITTIRMYYGNPNASAGSNGFDTFLFFDDFEAGVLDAVKWKTTAPITLESGRLKITKGAVYTAKTVAPFPDTTVEARASWNTMQNAGQSKLALGQAQQPVPGLIYMWTGGGTMVRDEDQKSHTIPNEQEGGLDMMNIWGLTADATDIYARYNRYYKPSIDLAVAFNYYLWLGHASGKLAELDDIRDMDVDWILVRRHAKPDPVTIIGGEKQP